MSDGKARGKIKIVAEAAIMLALSVILCEFAVIKFTFGGSVTVFGQVPIIIFAYRHGLKWGIAEGFAFSVVEVMFGLVNFSYVRGVGGFLICLLADYLVAFTALGLGGIFKNKIKNRELSLALGAVAVSLLRFACHYISGVTIWGEWMPEEFLGLKMNSLWVYSLLYNGSFMLPELIVSVVGVVVLSQIFDLDSAEIKPRKKR